LSFPPSPFTALVDFVASSDDAPPLRAAFGTPRERLVARTPAEVRGVLDAAMAHARAGRWCVGAVRYEAAKAFDAACEVHEPDGVLASFSVHDEPLPWAKLVASRAHILSEMAVGVAGPERSRRLAVLREQILSAGWNSALREIDAQLVR